MFKLKIGGYKGLYVEMEIPFQLLVYLCWLIVAMFVGS